MASKHMGIINYF